MVQAGAVENFVRLWGTGRRRAGNLTLSDKYYKYEHP